MLIAVDLDGSISAAPGQFGPMLSALIAEGHHVTIVTGTPKGNGDPASAFAAKVEQLDGLGCGDCWHDMVVLALADGPDLAAAKADWLRTNGASVFIDNNRGNAEMAVESAAVPLVLVPWATRTGSKNDGTSN